MEDSCHSWGRGGKKADVGKGGKKEGGEDIGTSEPHCRITRAGSCPESIKQPTLAAGRGGKFMTRLYAEIETGFTPRRDRTNTKPPPANFPPEKFLKIFPSGEGERASSSFVSFHPVRLTCRAFRIPNS